MKKSLLKLTLVTFMTLTLVPSSGYADTLFDKLGRGLTNLVTSPGEYVRQSAIKTEEKGLTQGFITAIFSGTYWTIVRALAGVYEIVTFPIPIPRGYRAIMQPEFVFNDVGLTGKQTG